MENKPTVPLIQFNTGSTENDTVVFPRKALSSHAVEITQQQISFTVAFFLISTFFIFIAGYFFGKQHAASFEDSQMTAYFFADTLSVTNLVQGRSQAKVHYLVKECSSDGNDDLNKDSEKNDAEFTVLAQRENSSITKNETWTYTELGRFMYEKDAQDFIEKIKRHTSAEVMTKQSVSAAGLEKIWYQVITKPIKIAENRLSMPA
jgi:hypothetical protein